MKKRTFRRAAAPTATPSTPAQTPTTAPAAPQPTTVAAPAEPKLQFRLTTPGKIVLGLLAATGLVYVGYKVGEAETDRAWVGSLNALKDEKKETAEPAEGSVQ